MKKVTPCPNCGKQIDAPSAVSDFVCRHCGEALTISSDDKIVLANPLPTYIDPERAAGSERGLDFQITAVTGVARISPHRRKRAADLALDRIDQEKRYALTGFVYGLLSVIMGGALLFLALYRHLSLAEDWINFAGFAFGLVFIPLGVYVLVSFSLSLRSWRKEEAEIEREIESLNGTENLASH